jgi:hypothetical protein
MTIFNHIMDALQPHMSGEEKYFYPAIKADDPKEENAFTVNEVFEEHKWVKCRQPKSVKWRKTMKCGS